MNYQVKRIILLNIEAASDDAALAIANIGGGEPIESHTIIMQIEDRQINGNVVTRYPNSAGASHE